MTEETSKRKIQDILRDGRTILMEHEAKDICKSYGIDVPNHVIAITEDEAVAKGSQVGYPLAAKLLSPDILHKSDIGGVMLDISDGEQVRAAYRRLHDAAKRNRPSAKIRGILLERMEQPGTEVIIGSTTDPQFGRVLMFGLGGIFVETYADVSFRIPPVTRETAREMIEELRAFPILNGERGRTKTNIKTLEDLIMKVSTMVEELDQVEEMDLNPVILHENRATAVDARIILGKSIRDHGMVFPHSTLEGFFKARSVAVVGASTTPGKIGHEALRNLSQYGFSGRVYPVNPTSESILGLKCYPNISSIPETPELVVFAVSSRTIPSIMEECGSKGVGNIVVISGGFKEMGKESARTEQEIVSIARKHGIRVVGPNCIGVLDTKSKLDSCFQPHDRMIRPSTGTVAFITQSGTIGCTFLEWAAEQGVGISKFVSYGNRCDVDEGDLVEYLGADDETKIIAIYVEGLSDGRKLFDAASRISKMKPVVILKAGKTRLGVSAAKSHTGALGGSHKVALGAFKQARMITAHDVQELFDMVKALTKQPTPTSEGIVMITNGAGPVVMAVDKYEEYGLKIARLNSTTIEELAKELPPYCYVTETTIDLTASGTSKDYETALRIAAKDSAVGLLAPFFVFQDPPLDEGILEVMTRIAELGKPVLCCAAGGPYTRKQANLLEAQNIPVYDTGERLAAAARALMMTRERQSEMS